MKFLCLITDDAAVCSLRRRSGNRRTIVGGGALRFILFAALAGSLQVPARVLAQQETPLSTEQQDASEFSRLIERWQKSNDPEDKITALEAALKLEPKLKAWPQGLPLKGARPQVRGTLQAALGYSYWQRRKGNRADNREKTIAALEVALTVFTREALPQQWALTQHNLAVAYRNRTRGDRADNLEKAIAAFEAALTVRTREALPQQWAQTQSNLALAYVDRIRGDRTKNLEKAIAAFEAALTCAGSDEDVCRSWQPRSWLD